VNDAADRIRLVIFGSKRQLFAAYLQYRNIIMAQVYTQGAAMLCLYSVGVRFSARHHREAIPLSLKAMKRWRETSANGDGQMCCMNVIK
jgi:hypothetical protein